jgi:predicted SnoaL-like aldol condensation-catalyzing enzyme
MFDGVAEINTASTLAADNAAAHLAATDNIFNNMDSEAVFASVAPSYIQHNPGGPNGPEGLAGTLGYLQSQNIALHKELKQTVVMGDFIVKLNYYSTTPVIPLFGNAIVFDIIRFGEDGRAAEHWDIVEEIANPEQIDDLF